MVYVIMIAHTYEYEALPLFILAPVVNNVHYISTIRQTGLKKNSNAVYVVF